MPGNMNNLENAFALWLQQEAHTIAMLGCCCREYQFAPPRKWRFDFAWPNRLVAVEIDGLMYDGKGGHQTVKGVLADAEKYEAALLAGWRVYRVPGPWIAEGDRAIWRPQVMETLKALLEA